jgi:hypothetical protein
LKKKLKTHHSSHSEEPFANVTDDNLMLRIPTGFKHLPLELRLAIWKLAIEADNVHILSIYKKFFPKYDYYQKLSTTWEQLSRPGLIVRHYTHIVEKRHVPNRFVLQASAKPSRFLQINQEARGEYIKKCTSELQRPGMAPLPFNYAGHTVLFFDAEKPLGEILGTETKELFENLAALKLTHIAVETRLSTQLCTAIRKRWMEIFAACGDSLAKFTSIEDKKNRDFTKNNNLILRGSDLEFVDQAVAFPKVSADEFKRKRQYDEGELDAAFMKGALFGENPPVHERKFLVSKI